MRHGFSLVELLMAVAAMAVLAVIATGFLFSMLTQRDQAVAEAMLTEQPEVVFAMVAKAVRSAETISVKDSGRRLETSRKGECFSFDWDEGEKVIWFGREAGPGCVPPSETTSQLTPKTVRVERVEFKLTEPNESGRNVEMEMDVLVSRPFWQTDEQWSQIFVNVVD